MQCLMVVLFLFGIIFSPWQDIDSDAIWEKSEDVQEHKADLLILNIAVNMGIGIHI